MRPNIENIGRRTNIFIPLSAFLFPPVESLSPDCLFLPLLKKYFSKMFLFSEFVVYLSSLNRGNSSVGRALASQAEGHGFEPRLPLHEKRSSTGIG